MTESFLVQLSHIFTDHADNYCILCLRTDKERRLESSKHVKKFLGSMGQRYSFKLPFQKVCFVCERQAALANRLLMAAQNSIRTHTLVHELKKPWQFSVLAQALLDAPDVKQPNRPYWLGQMLECESKLRRHRANTQLLQTEVLQLSSEDTTILKIAPAKIKDTFPLQTFEASVTCRESSDCYVIPDAVTQTEEHTSLVLNNDHKILESILIIDDDETEAIPTVPIETIHADSLNTETRIHSSNDQQLYVAAPETTTENDDNTVNVALHPIVVNNGITVPSLSATFRDGRLVETSTNIPIHTQQIAVQNGENINFISDPNEIRGTLKKLLRDSKCKVTSESVRIATKKLQEFEQGLKEPKLRCDRIDWEDKIPMDVISFFDEENEKDVCTNRTQQNMPEIEIFNVTSLSTNEVLSPGPDLGRGRPPPLAPLTSHPRRQKRLRKY